MKMRIVKKIMTWERRRPDDLGIYRANTLTEADAKVRRKERRYGFPSKWS